MHALKKLKKIHKNEIKMSNQSVHKNEIKFEQKTQNKIIHL